MKARHKPQMPTRSGQIGRRIRCARDYGLLGQPLDVGSDRRKMGVVEVLVDPAGEGNAGLDELGGVQMTVGVVHVEPPG